MIYFTPFRAGHMRYITPNSVQTEEFAWLQTQGIADLLEQGIAMTAWHDHVCLGAAGVAIHYPGLGECWLLLGANAGPHLLPCVRKMRRVIDSVRIKRVEMSVAVDNPFGHGLAKLLGFRGEAVLQARHPGGKDVVMYARIQP